MTSTVTSAETRPQSTTALTLVEQQEKLSWFKHQLALAELEELEAHDEAMGRGPDNFRRFLAEAASKLPK